MISAWPSRSLPLLGEQLLVGLQARLALGLARPRRHAHPLELALERALPRGLLLLLEREPLLLLLEPGGVVALPRDARAAVELEDPARDVVEEVPIVGDRDDRARVLLQEAARARRPTRRRGGWSARRAAACRASASRRRQSATRRRSPPESVATSASPGGQRSASIAISTVRSRSQPLATSMASCTRLCSAKTFSISSSSSGSPSLALISSKRVSRPRTSRHALLDVAAHVFRGVEPRLLRQVADPHAVGGPRLAEELLVDAGHDAQQRALARAVAAEDADLGARDRTTARCPSGSPASAGRSCSGPSSRRCTGAP